LKPLEAFAMGKAVVASSVGGMKAMALHERTALVFRKGNAEDLAKTIERLICSPELCEKLGKSAREWVIKERTWEATANKAMQDILRVIQAPASEREWL
jgi:glycosyltransferase involved in cell wall biosynthesis